MTKNSTPQPPTLVDRVVFATLPLVPLEWLHRVLRRVPMPPVERRTTMWKDSIRPVPESLQTQPGIRRDTEVEQEWEERSPLRDFFVTQAAARPWVRAHIWRSFIPSAPNYLRATRRIETQTAEPIGVRSEGDESSDVLTDELRTFAETLGISAIGFAPYDEKYIFLEHRAKKVGDTIIVLALEDDFADSQTVPSVRAERGVYDTCTQVMDMGLEVARWLRSKGYRARAHSVGGEGVAIHFGVQAGLGQLGLNGQLLTPHAGSRCRLLLVNTDAPITWGTPVDYGIPRICDECTLCVRACPAGAIPMRRSVYRGVEKAKINTARCWPTVAQADGCAVCLKVCPVQRYGLNAVLDHFDEHGEILGKGTEDLESYRWVDGRTYRAGNRPRLAQEFFEIPGFVPPPRVQR